MKSFTLRPDTVTHTELQFNSFRYVGLSSGFVHVCNSGGETLNKVQAHDAAVTAMVIWNGRVCTGSGDGKISVWE